MKNVILFLIYGNFFISLCTVALTCETYLLSNIPVDFNYLLFVFFSTLFIYNVQRVLFATKFYVSDHSERHRWILNHKKQLIILTVFSLTSILFISFFIPSENLILLMGTGIIASAYFLPFVNLRRIPGVKALLVAAVWTAVTVYFPIRFSSVSAGFTSITAGHRNFILLITERFLFLLALCIAFNIRDIQFDKNSGVNTLPVIYGIEKAKLIAYCLLLLFVVTLFIRDPSIVSICMAVSGGLTAWLIAKSYPESGEMHYSFLIDGTMILQAALTAMALRI